MENREKKLKDGLPMKSLLVLYSYHHHNTEKIAKVFAKVLDAEIKWPNEVNPEDLPEYDLRFWLRDILAQNMMNLCLNLLMNYQRQIISMCFFFQPLE